MHLPKIVALAFTTVFAGVPPLAPRELPTESTPQAAGLLRAAQGVSPEMCSLAANALMNGDWRPRPPYPAVARGESARAAMREGIGEAELAQLVAALSQPDGCTREVAVQLLAIPRSEAVSARLAGVLRTGDGVSRAAAAYALGLSGREQGVDALLAVLSDGEAPVRGNAAWALGMIDAEGTATGPLWRLVRDAEAPVRGAAVEALGRMEAQDSTGLLARVLANDADASVRRVAAWALAEVGARDAVAPLAGALRGARVVDERIVHLPAGEKSYEILRIDYPQRV
jgi:hypothetical protein